MQLRQKKQCSSVERPPNELLRSSLDASLQDASVAKRSEENGRVKRKLSRIEAGSCKVANQGGRRRREKRCCVCVCQNSLQGTSREHPQVQRNVQCSPFPPNGDVRLPKTGEKCPKQEKRCPSPSKIPWVLKKGKKTKRK